MLLPWLSRILDLTPPLPDDDLVGYDWDIGESNAVSSTAVYVFPPVIISEELD